MANTELDGMADHLVVRTVASLLMRECRIAQTIAFLRDGRFGVGWAKRSVPAIYRRAMVWATLAICPP